MGEKTPLFEAINIRNNLVASCFMFLEKKIFQLSYINILQIKFLKWKGLFQKCQIEYLISHKILSIFLNVVFIHQHIFTNISCELHIFHQNVMDRKRSDHIQRNRCVMKANNILQQPQKSCFKMYLSCIKLWALFPMDCSVWKTTNKRKTSHLFHQNHVLFIFY